MALLAEQFDRESNIRSLLSQSSLFARRAKETVLRSKTAKGQLSAKLHCLFGSPLCAETQDDDTDRTPYTYPYAISKVYDLRNYTTATLWGPFLGDGSQRVDWEFMESIMIVLGHNMRTSGECANHCSDLWVCTILVLST